MAKYKKKNIAFGAIGRLMLNDGLWNHRFTWAWTGCLLSVFLFDLLWCYQTSWRGMAYISTYVSALALATLMALPTVLSRRNWVQMAVLALFDVVFIANLMYCRTFYSTIPLVSYELAPQLLISPANIWDSFHWLYFLFPAILLGTFIMMIPDKDEEKPRILPYLLTLGLLSLIYAGIAMFNGGLTNHVNYLKSRGRNVYVPPVAYTLIGSLYAEADTHIESITPRQREVAANWGKDHLRYQTTMGNVRTDSTLRRDNLVFILCESLEAWPLGKSVEGQEITPNLNKLLRDSTTWYAPKVLSQAGNGKGVDAMLLMLAGMHPTQDQAWTTRHADNSFYTLPKAMKEQDANTYFISGDSPGMWNQGVMAESFGFDKTLMDATWNDSEKIGPRISDGALMQQSVAMMRRGDIWKPDERAFVQINTSSGRAPFDIPRSLQAIGLKGKYPRRLKDYITAANYTDEAVGVMLNYLKSRPDWKNTLVVIAGNHEALASWRYELRSSPAGKELVDGGGFVPVLMVNAPFSGKHDGVMGQVDVYTTILDQMGLPYRWRGMGFSALAAGSPEFAVTHQGTFEGRNTAVNPGLTHHVDAAREASDILIRFDLLNE